MGLGRPFWFQPWHIYTCAHTETCTHTHIHTYARHTGAHKHMYTYKHIHIHVHTCSYTCIPYIHTQAHTHICIHTYIHTHTCAYTHVVIHIYVHTHIHTHHPQHTMLCCPALLHTMPPWLTWQSALHTTIHFCTLCHPWLTVCLSHFHDSIIRTCMHSMLTSHFLIYKHSSDFMCQRFNVTFLMKTDYRRESFLEQLIKKTWILQTFTT